MVNDLGTIKIPDLTKFGFDSAFPMPIEYVWAWITGKWSSEYLKDCKIVYDRINYNRNVLNVLPNIEDVPFDDVFGIINSYIMLQNEEKFQPYQASNPNTTILSQVANKSGRTQDLTKEVLDQLYYATYDGSIATTRWLKPQSWRENTVYRNDPIEQTSGYAGTLLDIFNVVKWIVLIGGVGVGAYYLYKFIKEVS